jgi:hypothetical protein
LAPNDDYRASKVVFVMIHKDLRHKVDSDGGGRIRQPDDARVTRFSTKHQRSEIAVDRDQDSTRLGGDPQELSVTGIGTKVPSCENIVPLAAQPVSETPAGATVDQEFHP